MNEVEKKLWRKVFRFVPLLRFIPGIRMVAVCNNLAFSKVSETSDIDLFIVARKGCLFSVRFFVTLLLHVLAVRRHGNNVAGRFCLSFFVDDSHLDLHEIAIENDIYLAYWISTLVPVINDGVYDDFLASNIWVSEFVDTPAVNSRRQYRPLFAFSLFAENMLKKWQLVRARKKIPNFPDGKIIVSENILKFHNIDRRSHYRDLWLLKYGDMKVTPELFSTLQA